MGRGRRGNSHKAHSSSTPRSTTDHPTPSDVSSIPNLPHGSLSGSPALPPRKRQKREEYRQSINTDESRSAELPKKKWFRQRAHANPFSDHRLSYPVSPDQMDWSKHYPAFVVDELDVDDAAQKNNGHKILQERQTNAVYPKPMRKHVEIADIGCGYGGLLFALAPKLPDTLIIGLEIRTSITEFVDSKIRALRNQSTTAAESSSTTTPASPPTQHPAPPPQPDPSIMTAPVPAPGHYQNIATHRTNSMKFLPNFFFKASLSAIFLCFPDPHFKSRKHKARIVSQTLNAEYAYALRPGGHVYTITDVEELCAWMRERFDAHPAFERVVVGVEEASDDAAKTRVWKEERDGAMVVVDEGADEAAATAVPPRRDEDWLVRLMRQSTEEGKKVERFGGKKFVGVWRRLPEPAWPGEGAAADPGLAR